MPASRRSRWLLRAGLVWASATPSRLGGPAAAAEELGRDDRAALGAVARVAEVVQGEGVVDRLALALRVERGVDAALGQLERQRVVAGDPARQLERERLEIVAGDDVVDHAQPVRLGRVDRLGGGQQLLCLSRAQLERGGETLLALHSPGDDPVGGTRAV